MEKKGKEWRERKHDKVGGKMQTAGLKKGCGGPCTAVIVTRSGSSQRFPESIQK